MDHCKGSENEIMPSILCVKLEPFEEDDDCTQNLDPLAPDSKVHTKIELLQDFKTEIETDGSDQAVNELIQEDSLKNDLGDTETINIKTEYIGNEASALDNVLDARRIIEDGTRVHNQLAENSSNKYTEYRSVGIQKQTDEINTTRYQLSHFCKPQYSDVINGDTIDGNALNVTPLANHSSARSDTCSTNTDILSIHKHSRYEEEASKQSYSLIGHSLHHPSYVCEVCDMKFKNPRYLVKHKVVHSNEKPFTCDICKKGFGSSYYLLRHRRIHTGYTPYICNICEKGFSNSSDMVTHQRTHTGQKPYVCDICKKGFCQSSHLVAHKRTHTGHKPYVCDICNKGFCQSSHLVAHKRTHTGQKPYVCDICNKGFSDSSAMTRHRRIHTSEKPYVCDICTKGFTNSSNLVAHKRTRHVEKPCV